MGKHVQGPKQCEICLESLNREMDWKRHMMRHAVNKEDLMYRCAVEGCSFRSLQRPNVGQHYLSQHTDIMPMVACQLEVVDENGNRSTCSYSTIHPSMMCKHRKRVHGLSATRTRSEKVSRKALYDPYVLPPVTQKIIVDRAAGDQLVLNRAIKLKSTASPSQSLRPAKHDKKPAQSSPRDVLCSTQQSASDTRPVCSATAVPTPTIAVEDPNLLCTTRRKHVDAQPTLAPLAELELARKEGHGESTDSAQYSRLPASLRKILHAP